MQDGSSTYDISAELKSYLLDDRIIMASSENVRRTAYVMYKVDWKERHGITVREFNLLRAYHHWGMEKNCTFEEYARTFAYNGQMYASFDEFLKKEYLDEAYMGTILEEPVLSEYLHDVKMLKCQAEKISERKQNDENMHTVRSAETQGKI